MLCCAALLLSACKTTNKYYEEGLEELEDKNYVAAESCFKKAIDQNYDKNDVNELYKIVCEYNDAKKSYDSGEFDDLEKHLDKIPDLYAEFEIREDVDFLKDQLKSYKSGMTNLEIKDYASAETSFKKILDKDSEQNSIKILYTIVSEYNKAKSCCDSGEYETAETHLDKIPNSYTNYSIGSDIDDLKEQMKSVKNIDLSISKATSLLEAGNYQDANDILVKIDMGYLSAEQTEVVKSLQKRVQLMKKNKDPIVLERINALVQTHVKGLCEAVNTGSFKPLSGTLYKGSTIYTEYISYIDFISKQDLSEYCEGAEVLGVNWTSETECVISTIETYRIYYWKKGESVTQTFRYTYDVVETPDGQLFLTTLRESN